MRTALLLINLGTPSAPTPAAVRRYLREFLSDPRVIDINPVGRSLLLNLVILPFRPRKSARAYAEIFDQRGSPLLYHSDDLTAKVRERFASADVEVELAMRYGEPSIASALERLEARGVERVVVFPLYPQYATSTTGSTIEAMSRAVGACWVTPYLQFVPSFYEHPAFIEAVAARARPVLEGGHWERVLFSYHGLPVRHLRKGDRTGHHCLAREGCCESISPVNSSCYRAQCYATTRALAATLSLSEQQYVVAFQSRLGRTPWIEPYTNDVLATLAREGVKRLAVLTPAFTADCLETLEEIGMRAKEDWMKSGGEAFELIPCVNATDAWADAVVTIAREHSPWLH